MTPELARQIVRRHFRPSLRKRVTLALRDAAAALRRDRSLTGAARNGAVAARMEPRDPPVADFLGRQVHIATEHCGQLDPLDLDEYEAHGGFEALRTVVERSYLERVIDEIRASGLRGRGGAGFPTWRKWAAVRSAGDTAETAVAHNAPPRAAVPHTAVPHTAVPHTAVPHAAVPQAAVPHASVPHASVPQAAVPQGAGAPGKYVICNGDEGDPGAFMDRMLMESYPYRVIEGLAIAAIAVGATEGIFYIRAEYPLAVERIGAAIRRCEERGIIGDRLLGSGPPLHLRVVRGAGAFVCGEETALIASLEGRRGLPTLRPPYPAERGLHGRPTLVNNVETLAAVPWIIRNGPERFAALGTEASRGTKVFALAGKVARGGLIEVPMGITIREIVEQIGGTSRFKAVQIGGPSGGCIPARLADTPVDFERLAALGAIMGSGGLVVLDERDCMVELARYFLGFTQDQSCGKCVPCRIGTRRMLEILERLCAGQGRAEDLLTLEALAAGVAATSLCGLGKTAPNPVLTTLRYFRDEYEAHLAGRCPAGRCRALIRYRVTEKCTGCTLCAQHCPAGAIPLRPYERHEIDASRCTRCDGCRSRCPEEAIVVESP